MINNSYLTKFQEQLQQQQQQIQMQQQPQQPNITPEMQQIALQTEIGQKAYQDWNINKENILIAILRTTPEGAIAFNQLQEGLVKGYNHYIVSNIQQNNSGLSEVEALKKQLAEKDMLLAEIQKSQKIAVEQPPNNKGNK